VIFVLDLVEVDLSVPQVENDTAEKMMTIDKKAFKTDLIYPPFMINCHVLPGVDLVFNAEECSILDARYSQIVS
jgi:hypothetical protein